MATADGKVSISFWATPEDAARIDAVVRFDGKRNRAAWLRAYIMEMVAIAETEMPKEKVCVVDLSRAPGLRAALGVTD